MVACIGHWYAQLLYLVPVIVMGGLVGHNKLREQRRARKTARAPHTIGS
jgi:hypothetical protein